MSAVLFVRIKSRLKFEELERRLLERKPGFLEVPGLVQKIFGHDPASGDLCGIYFFESREALDAYIATELAKSIPDAYEATDIRREVFEELYRLRPEKGPDLKPFYKGLLVQATSQNGSVPNHASSS